MRVVGRPKVLLLLSHLHKGGMQRAVSNISLALVAHCDVSVGYFGTENPGFRFGGNVHNFNIPPSSRGWIFGKLWVAMRRLWSLRAFVERNEIGVVISFGESSNLYNLWSIHRAKKVISIRVAVDEALVAAGSYGRLIRLLISGSYRRADLLVTVSEGLRRYALSRWPSLTDRIVAIPNLYFIGDIQEQGSAQLPIEFRYLEGKPYVVAAGSLVDQKGFDVLIKAFARATNDEELKLVICGRGAERDELERLANREGLAGRVVFVGFDSNPYRFVSRATLFVMSSRFEGFPNALVEAMALGIPVIAFDCPTGPAEILGDSQFGWLVRSTSVQQLADTMALALRSAEARKEYSRLGMRRAEDFSAEVVVAQWNAKISKTCRGTTG